jgi:hypothetical protein
MPALKLSKVSADFLKALPTKHQAQFPCLTIAKPGKEQF